jgi:peptidylprolyl isomerase
MTKSLFALSLLVVTAFVAPSAAARKKPEVAPVSAPVSPLIVPETVAADPANRWTLELSNGGNVVIQLRPDLAPSHVYRIQQLTTQGFYNGLKFHRVIAGFMAQGGDPRGTGEGGSPLPDLKAEFNNMPHMRGVVSMARADDPNSANSQFFIMFTPRFSLDHKYTAFGRVVEGMAAVDSIAMGEPPSDPTTIVRASIGGPLPAPPAQPVSEAPADPAPAMATTAPAPAAEPQSEAPTPQ